MSIFVGFLIGCLALIALITLVNVMTAPMIKNGPKPKDVRLVSVLIPARNEEVNIGRALESLIRQSYQNLEILVLDDQSQDNTADIVRRFSAQDARIRLLSGAPLPVGWTGKNWACHQLSQAAGGDYLIFTDADNQHAPEAVEKTIGWMQRLSLSLFSAFPQQITVTFAEKLVIPVFDTFVYSLLPLWLTYYAKFPSMAAANGQWLAFTRQGYDQIGGHEAVKGHIVEDTELARLAKQKGEKILTASGNRMVFGRMYSSWNEVYWGFSKNAFGLMGYKTIPFLLFSAFLFSIYILPFPLLAVPSLRAEAVAMIGLAAAIRFLIAERFGHPVWVSTLLNPLSIGAVLMIGFNSFRCYRRGAVSWKDRKVSFIKAETRS
ncbi:MAG: glycosyltransferase [candidate division KSB1 bacterium]|nr:glycosyltransferase [candidate division KSB1 bacterium]